MHASQLRASERVVVSISRLTSTSRVCAVESTSTKWTEHVKKLLSRVEPFAAELFVGGLLVNDAHGISFMRHLQGAEE